MNYQEGIETQEKIEALQDEMKTIDGNVLNLQDEMKAIKGDIRLILKLLSDKS